MLSGEIVVHLLKIYVRFFSGLGNYLGMLNNFCPCQNGLGINASNVSSLEDGTTGNAS